MSITACRASLLAFRRVSDNSRKLGKFGKKSGSGQALQTSLTPELTSNNSLEEEALILKVNTRAAKTGFSSVLFVVKTTVLGFIESKIRAPVCLFLVYVHQSVYFQLQIVQDNGTVGR